MNPSVAELLRGSAMRLFNKDGGAPAQNLRMTQGLATDKAELINRLTCTRGRFSVLRLEVSVSRRSRLVNIYFRGYGQDLVLAFSQHQGFTQLPHSAARRYRNAELG